MKCEHCVLPAYYVLDDGRGFCTQLHAAKSLGKVPVHCHPEKPDGTRRLEILPEPYMPPRPKPTWRDAAVVASTLIPGRISRGLALVASGLRREKGPAVVHPSQDHPDHISEIIERHEISVPIVAGQLGEERRAYLWSVCRRLADEWAEREGIALLDATVFERPHATADRESAVGVTWTVVVGKAVASPAGSEPSWRWSARWLSWLHLFSSMRDGPPPPNVQRVRFDIPRNRVGGYPSGPAPAKPPAPPEAFKKPPKGNT